MPVVINEFEVVEGGSAQRAEGGEASPSPDGAGAQQSDPLDLCPLLGALHAHAARAWAH